MNPYNQNPQQGYPQQGYNQNPQQYQQVYTQGNQPPQTGFTPTPAYYPPTNYPPPQNLYPNTTKSGPSSQFSVRVPGLVSVSVPTSFGLHKGNQFALSVPGVTLSVPANDPHHPSLQAQNITGQTFYSTTATTTTQPQQFAPQPGYVQNQPGFVQNQPGYPIFQPMDPNGFKQLNQQVSKESFASGKLTVIEVASKNYFFTSQQVYELVNSFTFAKDQLRACEILYSRVVDQANFHIVLSAFTFDSDKKKLKEMLHL